jgi:2-iminobutanoate/2-iminopropanoate deaminase
MRAGACCFPTPSEGEAMKRERILTPESHEPEPGMWSNCFKVGNLVIMAGMASKGLDGKVAHKADPYQQTVFSFRRMKAYVEAAGGTMDDIVKLTCYLTDIRFRPDFVRARKEFFKGDFPPCVVIGNVTLASEEILVEIDAWGIVGSGSGKGA